ncbi:MAG: type II toxin-antitoxin system VapC family toxin [Crocosphaera sp.]|nr:type II toxin-antitoxin system VapC family toxin [Crocosphaera sp.]
MKTVPKAILDTDILSAIMRRNPLVIPKATEYLSQHSQFTFSLITRYEIIRGLKAKNAIKQLKSFDEFCVKSIILPLSDEIIVQAADIYANLRSRGLPIGDADIMIAATAIIFNLVVITNNENHFRRISRIQVYNWLQP